MLQQTKLVITAIMTKLVFSQFQESCKSKPIFGVVKFTTSYVFGPHMALSVHMFCMFHIFRKYVKKRPQSGIYPAPCVLRQCTVVFA